MQREFWMHAAMGKWNQSKPTSLLSLPKDFVESASVVHHQQDASCLLSITQDAAAAAAMPSQDARAEDHRRPSFTQWACSLCHSTFPSLEDQRSHFKSDFHRFNIKRKLAKKVILTEEEFEVLVQDSFERDDDISSISGSEEEDEDTEAISQRTGRTTQADNAIAFFCPKSGNIISIWKSILIGDKEELVETKALDPRNGGCVPYLTEEDVLKRLESLVAETNKKQIWVFLLASGGHFAGCIFDVKGDTLLAHKTYHRYVVRAKAGARQSTKDATGKAPKSAGASLRRQNEMKLQKEIREVLATWKNHIDSASCIFVHAPSSNGNAFFGGENSPLDRHDVRIRRIPFTTRRPTLKEVKRVIHVLTTVNYKEDILEAKENKDDNLGLSNNEINLKHTDTPYISEVSSVAKMEGESTCKTSQKTQSGQLNKDADVMACSSREQSSSGMGLEHTLPTCIISTPLHDAAKSGNVAVVLELLEKGSNPCARDERGRTPYAIAADKETRNAFRRFMAEHLEMWDWHAANVPSPLTEDMEATKAAKQAEKEARRKAKAKELKKQRKAKEQARAQANLDQPAASVVVCHRELPDNKLSQLQGKTDSTMSEKSLKKAEDIEREKRAAAAEKRIAAMSIGAGNAAVQQTSSETRSSTLCNGFCSCCGVSLAGKTPFYRYSYKYCSTTCVHTHRKALEGIEYA